MIALLTGLGLSKTLAKIIAYVGVPLLILGAFYLALDAYGDARFREGRQVEEKAWKDAQDKLLAQAAQGKTEADKKALAAQMDQAVKVQEEKEKVDEAIADGASPFDVLFPHK